MVANLSFLPANQRDEKQNQEDREENTRDVGRSARGSPESKCARYQGNQQKNESVV